MREHDYTFVRTHGILAASTSEITVFFDPDVDFFTHLEMHMRQESWPLCGRDQLSFRSSYFPVKDCVDGDLCEMFTSLPLEKQREIAEELDRTPNEVVKKLEDLRNRIL